MHSARVITTKNIKEIIHSLLFFLRMPMKNVTKKRSGTQIEIGNVNLMLI